jgi:hypothetical protein
LASLGEHKTPGECIKTAHLTFYLRRMMQFWGETMAARSSAVILSELSQESVDALATKQQFQRI